MSAAAVLFPHQLGAVNERPVPFAHLAVAVFQDPAALALAAEGQAHGGEEEIRVVVNHAEFFSKGLLSPRRWGTEPGDQEGVAALEHRGHRGAAALRGTRARKGPNNSTSGAAAVSIRKGPCHSPSRWNGARKWASCRAPRARSRSWRVRATLMGPIQALGSRGSPTRMSAIFSMTRCFTVSKMSLWM